MSFLDKLPRFFETKPLVLLRFADGFEHDLSETKDGKERFTVVKPHGAFDGVRTPTLCLAEMPEGASSKCYVGIVRSKAGVATFDSRITVLKLQLLKLSSFKFLASKLSPRSRKEIVRLCLHGKNESNAKSRVEKWNPFTSRRAW